MSRVVWTAEAVDNLDSIFTYVASFNASAAARLAQRLQAASTPIPNAGGRSREDCANWR
jgi:toxin ParE1/3/4